MSTTEHSPSIDAILAPWTGPHGGTPRFDLIKPADFKDALLKAMDLKRTDIQAIVKQTDKATFENTIAALEDSGRVYSRAISLFGIYTSTMNDDMMKKLDEDMAPLLAAFSDEILLNDLLFQRVKAVYEARENSGLSPEQQRVSQEYYSHFTRNGAALEQTKKARLSQINEQLATLFTTFAQNQQADEENDFLALEKLEDLVGLPESMIAAAAEQAKERGLEGKWVLATSARPSNRSSVSRRDGTCARSHSRCGRRVATKTTSTTTRRRSLRS